MESHINILIADDHQMFIDGIRSLLENYEEIKIVAEANNGEEVMDAIQKHTPHVVLLDINMPKMNGVEAIRKIHKVYPDVKVIMLTMYNTQEHIAQVIANGAQGYILKNTGKEELLKAIHTVFGGETYFSKEVTDKVIQIIRNHGNIPEGEIQLSKRETDIIKLIAQEKTTKEIAKELFISENTVETHRKNILSKLNVRNTAGVIKYAMQNGILDN